MVGDRFISAEIALEKFGLKKGEMGSWNAVIGLLRRTWQIIFHTPQGRAYGGEWLEVYPSQVGQLPTLVVQAKEGFEPRLGPCMMWIPMSAPIYSIGKKSTILYIILEECRLARAQWNKWGEDLVLRALGYVR